MGKGKIDAPKKLKILFTVVNKNKVDFYIDALETFDVNFQTVIYGNGFVFDEIDDKVLNSDTAIIVSVVEEERVPEILATYEDKYFKTRNGKGYGIVVSMNSLIGVLSYKFLANIGVE